MNTKTIKSVIALILALAALILYVIGYKVVGMSAITLAFFVNIPDTLKISKPIFFINSLWYGAALGIMIDIYAQSSFPYITLALCFSFVALWGRSFFTKIYTYTNMLWAEWFAVGAMLSFYIIGNLGHSNLWISWTFPAPILILSSFFAINGNLDSIKLKKAAAAAPLAEVGKSAPEFSLPDQDGNEIALSSFKEQRHVLLLFVKGDWCPACHMMLRTYQKEKDKFQEKNIVTMAIGPDPVGVNRQMVQKLGVEYKVLSDDAHKVSVKYGLPNFGAGQNNQENGYALPASFLIDKSGIVRYTSRPDKVGEFLNPSLIFPIVESLA